MANMIPYYPHQPQHYHQYQPAYYPHPHPAHQPYYQYQHHYYQQHQPYYQTPPPSSPEPYQQQQQEPAPISPEPVIEYVAPEPEALPAISFAPSNTTAFTPIKSLKRRSVAFTPTVRVKTVDRLSSTPEQKSQLYYTKSDMNGFYLQVKQFHSQCKHDNNVADSAATGGGSSSLSTLQKCARQCLVRSTANGGNPALRGLELFFFPIRVRNKQLARKSLLKFYKDLCDPTNEQFMGMDEEEKAMALSAASVKLSQWAKVVARETGRMDMMRAYPEAAVTAQPSTVVAVEQQKKRKCAPNTGAVLDAIPDISQARAVSFDDSEDEDSQPSSKRRRL